jgi:hypothetical protein
MDHGEEPGIELVHGTYMPGILRSGHAWVEIPNDGRPLVFDGALQRFCELATYYRVMRVEVERRYRPTDHSEMVRRGCHHFGPRTADEVAGIPQRGEQ